MDPTVNMETIADVHRPTIDKATEDGVHSVGEPVPFELQFDESTIARGIPPDGQGRIVPWAAPSRSTQRHGTSRTA